MGNDGFQIVKMRSPSERGADTVASRHDVGWIICPPARVFKHIRNWSYAVCICHRTGRPVTKG